MFCVNTHIAWRPHFPCRRSHGSIARQQQNGDQRREGCPSARSVGSCATCTCVHFFLVCVKHRLRRMMMRLFAAFRPGSSLGPPNSAAGRLRTVESVCFFASIDVFFSGAFAKCACAFAIKTRTTIVVPQSTCLESTTSSIPIPTSAAGIQAFQSEEHTHHPLRFFDQSTAREIDRSPPSFVFALTSTRTGCFIIKLQQRNIDSFHRDGPHERGQHGRAALGVGDARPISGDGEIDAAASRVSQQATTAGAA